MDSHDLGRILLMYPNEQIEGVEEILKILKKFNDEDLISECDN